MFLLKMIRKFFAILKSCQSPGQIAVGVIIGMAVGLAPMGLHTVLTLSLAAVFACSFSAALYAFGFFKLLGWLVWQPAYAIGFFTLERIPFLQGPLDAMMQWPVLALCNFNRYTLAGSYVVSLLLALPMYWLVSRGIAAYRGSLSSKVESSALYKAASGFFLFRFVRWVLFAGEAKFKEPAKEVFLPFRYVRKQMLVLIPALYFLLIFGTAALATFLTGTVAAGAVSFATGGAVDVSGVGFNPFSGRFSVGDVQVQNPKKLEENILSLKGMAMDIGMVPLLSGRLVADELAVEEIGLHVKREADGSLNIDGLEDLGTKDGETSESYEKYKEWVKTKAKETDWVSLAKRYLQYRNEKAEETEKERAEGPDMTWVKTGKRDIERAAPWLEIRNVHVGSLNIELSDAANAADSKLLRLSKLQVSLNDFNSHPMLARRKMTFDAEGMFNDDPGKTCKVAGSIDYSQNGIPKDFLISVAGIDLPRVAGMAGDTLPVEVLNGTARLDAKLLLQADGSLFADNLLRLHELNLRTRSSGSFLDLNTEMTSMAIDVVNEYGASNDIVLQFPVGGTAESPDFSGFELAFKRMVRDYATQSGKRAWKTLAGEFGDLADLPIELPTDFDQFSKQLDEAAKSVQEDVKGKVEGTVKNLLDDLWKKK